MNSVISSSYVLIFWILAVISVGLTTGFLIDLEKASGRVFSARGAAAIGILYFIGLAVDLHGSLSGLPRVYLETALLFFGVYFLSSLAATLLAGRWQKKARPKFYEGWAYGLIPTALAWLIATHSGLPIWQAEAKEEIAGIARKVNIDASDIAFFGLDVLLPPSVAKNSWLVGEISRVPGVSGVVEESAPPTGEVERRASGVVDPAASVTEPGEAAGKEAGHAAAGASEAPAPGQMREGLTGLTPVAQPGASQAAVPRQGDQKHRGPQRHAYKPGRHGTR